VDINDLRVTADLARLPFGEAELEAALPAFEQVVGYFEAMRGADVGEDGGDGRPVTGPAGFRPDAAISPPGAGEADALLALSGERDQRYIVIPNVL